LLNLAYLALDLAHPTLNILRFVTTSVIWSFRKSFIMPCPQILLALKAHGCIAQHPNWFR
jgi:hypothetical protein